MNKSLLAVALVAFSTASSAAVIYDKDGTNLSVVGRIQAVAYSGNYNKAGSDDSTLWNSSRFGLAGRTNVNDYFAVYGFADWDMADGCFRDSRTDARHLFVGTDFKKYGKLQFGKQLGSVYDVQNATDTFEETGIKLQSNSNRSRRPGTIRYMYQGYGVNFSASYQTAADNVPILNDGYKRSVKSGYSVGIGYTFENIVFGPLSFKTAYEQINGQKDGDRVDATLPEVRKGFGSTDLDNMKHVAASIAWGKQQEGLYFGTLFENYDLSYENSHDLKIKGIELVCGYAFESGFVTTIGYNLVDKKTKDFGVDSPSTMTRRIPVIVRFKATPNAEFWTEVEFDANSSDNTNNEKKTHNNKDTLFAAGARYWF